MRAALWPQADGTELRGEAEGFTAGSVAPTVSMVFIADDGVRPIGFLELCVRAFANGCDSMPVPFIEGWFVLPEARGHGIGRALVLAAEEWSRARGFTEIGSDAEISNPGSLAAHEHCGFIETERVVYFRKTISGTGLKHDDEGPGNVVV
jgi:aminoglycoside 6'-N-acetyltransferase I